METRKSSDPGSDRLNKALKKDMAEAQKNRARRRIRNKNRKIMFRSLFLFGIVLVVGLAFLAYSSQINYRINETEQNIAKLENEIENLNLEIAANSSPEIIEKKAIEELGMEYPNASQYIYLDRVTREDVQTAKTDD